MRPSRRCILLGMAFAIVTAGALQGCRYLPRMDRQAHIRPYERRMPETPPHSVPRHAVAPVPTADEAARLPNPIAPTTDALGRAKFYYGYYCTVCHGGDGRGHVPVGESYHPAPRDLGSEDVQAKSDGELYRAMVVGTGHEPTLAYIVSPERRWLIVHHMRTLARSREDDRAVPVGGQ